MSFVSVLTTRQPFVFSPENLKFAGSLTAVHLALPKLSPCLHPTTAGIGSALNETFGESVGVRVFNRQRVG